MPRGPAMELSWGEHWASFILESTMVNYNCKIPAVVCMTFVSKVKLFLLLPLVPSFSSHLWLRYAPACLLPATALAPLLLLQTSNLPLCAHWAIRHLLCGRALGCSRSGRQQSGQGCAPGWHCSHSPSATCGEGTTPLRASASLS